MTTTVKLKKSTSLPKIDKTTSFSARPSPATSEISNVPQNLNNHSAVASILIQQQGKKKVKELKARAETTDTRQAKEYNFVSEINKQREFEKLKEIKWFVCKGSAPMTEEEKQAILSARIQQEQERLAKEAEIVPAKVALKKRVMHEANVIPPSKPGPFVPSPPEHDAIRIQVAIFRFILAARMIIIKRRLLKRLAAIKKFLAQFGYDRQSIAKVIENEKFDGSGTQQNEKFSFSIPEGNIRPFMFPVFAKVQTKASTVSIQPFINQISEEMPSFPMREAEEYKIKNYQPVDLIYNFTSTLTSISTTPALRKT